MAENDRDEELRELQSLLCNYANARAKTKEKAFGKTSARVSSESLKQESHPIGWDQFLYSKYSIGYAITMLPVCLSVMVRKTAPGGVFRYNETFDIGFSPLHK